MGEIVKVEGKQLESTIAREVQQVQAQVVMAKKFPRNIKDCYEKIKTACSKVRLAEVAMYQYPKGREIVSGASIRLAEAVAQIWGNVEYGVREIERGDSESTIESYAWDLETNTRVSKIFSVKHERYSKEKGNVKLTEQRDIYEAVANNASRRVRACILSIIPAEIMEMAMKQVAMTQKTNCDTTPEGIRLLATAFEEFGISIKQLSEFIGKPIELIEPAEIMRLKRVYVSIRDGFALPEDYFKTEEKEPEQPEAKQESLTKKRARKEKEDEPKDQSALEPDDVRTEEELPDFAGKK